MIVSRCQHCSASWFPARLLCPKCGGADLKEDEVGDGIVEECVTVRHAAGHGEWQPHHLATIRTAEGIRIVAGLVEELPAGTAVRLTQSDGAISATRR